MGSYDALIKDIRRLAEPVCVELGIEIVELDVHPYQGALHIRILADKPEGGIGMEACAALNSRVSARIGEELVLAQEHTLEVSSPGLDRVLVGCRELRRVLGRDVQVFLKERLDGKLEISGCLTAVREADIILQTRRGEVVVPMGHVDKAKQIIN